MKINKIKKDEGKTRKWNTNGNKWAKPHIKWILNKHTGAGWREWELSEVALGCGIWAIFGLHTLNKCWTLDSGVFSQRCRLFSVVHSRSWVSQCGRREYKHAKERQLMNLLSWIVTGGISVSSWDHMYPQSQMEMAGCYMTGVVQYVWCSVCCVVCGGCCVVVVIWYVLCGVCVRTKTSISQLCLWEGLQAMSTSSTQNLLFKHQPLRKEPGLMGAAADSRAGQGAQERPDHFLAPENKERL